MSKQKFSKVAKSSTKLCTVLGNVFYKIKVKYYFLKVKLHLKFKRNGIQVPVSFSEKQLKELTKV